MRNTVFDQKFINDTSAQIVETAERAVFDATAWDDFVEVLGEAFAGSCVVFQRLNLRRNKVEYDRIRNMDPADVDSYRQHYSSLNPWVQHMVSGPSGTVIVGERDCPQAKFRNAEFYDWLDPELRAAVGLTLEATSENLAVVGVHYGVERAGSYDPSVSELLHRISKPLLRSTETARLFEQTMDRERSAAAIVSRFGDIACVVDEQLRVKDANALAENEFQRRKLMSVRAGKLSVLAAEINGWLAETLQLWAAGLEPGATTRIFFADCAYQIGIVRLSEGSGVRPPFAGGPLFLIIVRVLSGPAQARTIADLATAFGLTPAEQRLCEVLSLGHSLKEAADLLGVASETVRHRLKVIFQKTDTHKQSELIALMGRLL